MTIHFPILLFCQCEYSSRIIFFGKSSVETKREIYLLKNEFHRRVISNSLIAVFIDIDCKMSWMHFRTIVQISIIHWQHIDIMEDETFPFSHSHRFNETDIIQCALIEPIAVRLENNENLIFKLLPH